MGVRVTMTKAQVDSKEGQELLRLIFDICHDGEVEYFELHELISCIEGCAAKLPAHRFLREIAEDAIQDGRVDAAEAYALKRGFCRVVPKDMRGIIETHLADIDAPPKNWESPNAKWRSHPASLRQLDFIAALGGYAPDGLSKGEASEIIDQLIENRPPSPRQMMLLRFFDRLDFASSGKDEVSFWVSEWFDEDPRRESSWNWFKIQNGIMSTDRDPSVVPVGAYFSSPSGPPSDAKRGCLGALLIVPLFFN